MDRTNRETLKNTSATAGSTLSQDKQTEQKGPCGAGTQKLLKEAALREWEMLQWHARMHLHCQAKTDKKREQTGSSKAFPALAALQMPSLLARPGAQQSAKRKGALEFSHRSPNRVSAGGVRSSMPAGSLSPETMKHGHGTLSCGATARPRG